MSEPKLLLNTGQLKINDNAPKNQSHGIFSCNSVWCSPVSVSGQLNYLTWDPHEILQDTPGVEYEQSDETCAVQGFLYLDRINEDILTRHLSDIDSQPDLAERYDLRHVPLWDGNEADRASTGTAPWTEMSEPSEGDVQESAALKASMHTESTYDETSFLGTTASGVVEPAPQLESQRELEELSTGLQLPSKPPARSTILPSLPRHREWGYGMAFLHNTPLGVKYSRRPARKPASFSRHGS